MVMAAVSNPTVLTVSGTPTPVEYFPLSTPWPSQAGCSSNIYRQLGGSFLGWDPLYGASLDSNARTCLPPQVTSWWNQFDQSARPTFTALGPTFVCPEAYYAVQTVIIASDTQQIFCCPSKYSLFVLQPNTQAFPSQCTSLVAPGESLTYLSPSYKTSAVNFNIATTTIASTTATVFGIPVNGFNVEPQSATSTPTRTSGTGVRAGSITATNSIASATSSSKGSSGPSLATSVGVSIGVVFGILALAASLFFLWRRRRRRRRMGQELPGQSPTDVTLPVETPRYQVDERKYELYGGSHADGTEIYELPGRPTLRDAR